MTQLVTRIPDDMAKLLDQLVDEGVFRSRSDAVRTSLEEVLAQHRRRRISEQTVRAYREQPQTDDEFAGVDVAAAAMIAEEPW